MLKVAAFVTKHHDSCRDRMHPSVLESSEQQLSLCMSISVHMLTLMAAHSTRQMCPDLLSVLQPA